MPKRTVAAVLRHAPAACDARCACLAGGMLRSPHARGGHASGLTPTFIYRPSPAVGALPGAPIACGALSAAGAPAGASAPLPDHRAGNPANPLALGALAAGP